MILRAEGITRKYPRMMNGSNFFYAVKETGLEIREGTVTEIVGRSGSGKTTLLNMLAGLLAPSEGQVLLDGQSLYGMDDRTLSELRNCSFGVVPQGQSGLDSLTALENVLLPYSLYRKERDGGEGEAYALWLLERLGIGDLREVHPGEMSGGEIRRLAIARALVMKPKFLFADEPTGDLDDENTKAILKLFRELSDQGTAVVMVTHDLEAKVIADHIYRMDAGVLTQES